MNEVTSKWGWRRQLGLVRWNIGEQQRHVTKIKAWLGLWLDIVPKYTLNAFKRSTPYVLVCWKTPVLPGAKFALYLGLHRFVFGLVCSELCRSCPRIFKPRNNRYQWLLSLVSRPRAWNAPRMSTNEALELLFYPIQCEAEVANFAIILHWILDKIQYIIANTVSYGTV